MTDPASTEATVRQFFEAFYTGDAAGMDALVAPGFTTHAPGGGTGNIEGWKAMAVQMREAIPDLRTTLDDVVADEHRVAVRYTSRGVRTGELFGIAPDGTELTMTGIEVYHLSEGKITEVWGQYDMSDLFGRDG